MNILCGCERGEDLVSGMNSNGARTLEWHLAHQLKKWTENPDRYLGLTYGPGEKEFSAECPPLLCMVDQGVVRGNCVLIISLEPLRSDRTFS